MRKVMQPSQPLSWSDKMQEVLTQGMTHLSLVIKYVNKCG